MDASYTALRHEMERIADLSERWTDCLVSQINEIARAALKPPAVDAVKPSEDWLNDPASLQSGLSAFDAHGGFTVKLDNWMAISVEDGGIILRNEAGEPIAFGKLGPDAKLPTTAAPEPFGYWVEQKHADPVLLRKPAYIPEPSELRTVTPLYAAPAVNAVPAGEVEVEVERIMTMSDDEIMAEADSDDVAWARGFKSGLRTGQYVSTAGAPVKALRSIVVKYTQVGGYPDTYAIARDAYNLARASLSHGEGRK